MIKATMEKYRDLAERILRFYIINGSLPAYGQLEGVKYTKEEYIDAIKRVQKFLNENGGKYPAWVRIGVEPTTTIPVTNTSSMPNTCANNQLKEGCSGENVKALQVWLRDHGFYKGKVDGKFGPITTTAVKAFQTAAGTSADGWVGDKTRAKMASWGTQASGVYVESSWLDYDQTTNYTCGPASTYMALSTLGVPNLKEMELAVDMGTIPGSGTDHKGLMNGAIKFAKKQGVAIEAWEQNFGADWNAAGRLIADPNIAVVWHGNTQGWRRYYQGNYGHYVFVVKIDTNKKEVWVADPARSATLVYTFSEFIQGLNYVSQPSLIVFKRV
jgi:predicted double-glycine peptidase